ncbi:MAG: hypothetical protein H0U77_04270 [Nocardioidaceae bacterium]|nr:hypothetical protein [Nocardioidaceae bacterium]
MSRQRVDAEFGEFVASRSAALLRLAWLLAPHHASADDLLQTALLRGADDRGGA